MRVENEGILTKLGIYIDENNNEIECCSRCVLEVMGSNNKIYIGKNVKNLLYHNEVIGIRCGSNNTIIIGDGTTHGSDCAIKLGDNCLVSLGEDCMLSNEVLYSCQGTGNSIVIGEHVWFGLRSAALSGSKIGDGSIVGACGILDGQFPNNCIVAGNPAKVIRQNVAWHRSRDEKNIERVNLKYRELTMQIQGKE